MYRIILLTLFSLQLLPLLSQQFKGGDGGGYMFLSQQNSPCNSHSTSIYYGGNFGGAYTTKSNVSSCSPIVVSAFSGNISSNTSTLTMINSICHSGAASIFAGGDSDGYVSVSQNINACFPIVPSAFTGGISDGSSGIQKLNSLCHYVSITPFAGNIGQGYSFDTSAQCQALTFSAFTGGIADGSSQIIKRDSDCHFVSITPFAGNSSDGYDYDYTMYCPPITFSAFTGSLGDGETHVLQKNNDCHFVTITPYAGNSGDGSDFALNGHCFPIAFSAFSGGVGDGSHQLSVIGIDPLCISLPIELIDFRVKPEDELVRLNWTTASERNNHHFDILKSYDMDVWTKIGEVPGKGDSHSLQQYQFNDSDPKIGIQYYKLKQVDNDGFFTYSGERSAYYQYKDAQIRVFPNPTSEYVHIELIDPSKIIQQITISDGAGQLIYQSKENLLPLNPINLSSYAVGIYLIAIEIEDQIEIHKLIKSN